MSKAETTSPRNRRAVGAGSPAMQARVVELRGLIAQGYTVQEAGREIGLTRSKSQDTARRFGLRALPGPISEAKHLAGVRGNEVRLVAEFVASRSVTVCPAAAKQLARR